MLVRCLALSCAIFIAFPITPNARTKPPTGGRIAVVIDERLSALRMTPELSGRLVRRMSRGQLVAIRGESRSPQGVIFYRVNITRRTGGWIQREAVVSSSRRGDDARLLKLIKGSEDFDLIVRARIFLSHFRLSPLRPEVLMLYALAGERAADHLSRDANRRLDETEMTAGGAPPFSYFLNYNGLDRYNRQGINFIFNSREKRFYYDGEGWREILYRYPNSLAAVEARKRLGGARARH